jgi:hypothetical protein
MTPVRPPASVMRSPTFACAATQCCPSAPVSESARALVTEPGMYTNQQPVKLRLRVRTEARCATSSIRVFIGGCVTKLFDHRDYVVAKHRTLPEQQ